MGLSLLGMASKMTSGTITTFDLFGRIRKFLGFSRTKISMPAVKDREVELAGLDYVIFVE
jgi:hypothetical protein